jgi:hypothetical protein
MANLCTSSVEPMIEKGIASTGGILKIIILGWATSKGSLKIEAGTYPIVDIRTDCEEKKERE